MWGNFSLLLGSFFVLCAFALKNDDQLDELKYSREEEWKTTDRRNWRKEETILNREIDSSRDVIDANKNGCWRYCVKKKEINSGTETKDAIKRVNIIWNVMDAARVTLSGKATNYRGIPSDQDKNLRWESSILSSDKSNSFYDEDPKCELYLELGCRSLDKTNSFAPDEFLNSNENELVAKNNVTGLNTNMLSVNENVEKLRILVSGKLSQVVLEIPIARRETNITDPTRTRPMFSLSRTNDAKGLIIDARNPPPGEWRMNLLGMKNSNYGFTVTAVSSKKNIHDNDPINEKPNAELSELLWSQQLANSAMIEDNSAQATILDEQQREVRDNSTDYARIVASYQLKTPSARALRLETNETNSLESPNTDAEFMETGNAKIVNKDRIDMNARLLENSEFDVDNIVPKKITVVDLDPSTELIVRPDTLHDVVFAVTNNQPVSIRHTFRGSSQQFPYIGVLPNAFWMRAGETINVAVRILVPNVENPEPNKVTLFVGGSDNFEGVKKSTYVYVQGSRGTITTDSNKPNIVYSFNDNCAWKLHRDRCERSRWSVEITIHDPDSGLKRVSSLPNGIRPLTEFISGTRNKVTFYYSSTCCYTTVDITATDVQGNFQTLKIDVTAWDNLSTGEIAAIVVGTFLILLLLIFIILIIIFCIRKRKSHDLSYSQRYGSRTQPTAERTNF